MPKKASNDSEAKALFMSSPGSCYGTCGEPHGRMETKTCIMYKDLGEVERQLDNRPKTTTLISVLSIIVVIFIAICGIYSTSVGKDVENIKEGVSKDISTILETQKQVLDITQRTSDQTGEIRNDLTIIKGKVERAEEHIQRLEKEKAKP